MDLIVETLKSHSRKDYDPDTPINAVKLSHDLKSHVTQRKKTFQKLRLSLELLKPIIEDSVGDPSKRYSHDEWKKVLDTVAAPPPNTDGMSAKVKQEVQDRARYYWLSERSPLRLPIMEPNYMILKLFFRVEHDIQSMLDDEGEVLRNLKTWIERAERKESDMNTD